MDEITKNLQVLYHRPSWLFGPSRKERVKALKTVASLGTPFSSVYLFSFLFGIDRKFKLEVGQTIFQLMSKIKECDWIQLYDTFRHTSLAPKNIAYLAAFPPHISVSLLGLASLNRDGHVRQAALEEMERFGLPESIPFVILRLSDWVPNVRDTARQIIERMLASGQVKYLFRYSFLIDRLRKVERVNLSDTFRNIIDAYFASASRGEIFNTLQIATPGFRMFCYECLMAQLGPEIIEKSVQDNAQEIRIWAIKNLWRMQTANSIPLLSRLLNDKASGVRLVTVQSIPDDLWSVLEPQVLNMIWDNSTGVREAARFYLARHGRGNFAELCRNRIDQGATIIPGLIGCLCETGTKSDFDLISDYASHPSPKIREAVISGLGRLDMERAVDMVIKGLNDTKNRVRRTAVNILKKAGSSVARDRVLTILKNGNEKGKLAALEALAEMGRWESFRDIVFSIASEDTTIFEKAWEYLGLWISRNSAELYTKPSMQIASELKTLLKKIHKPSAPELHVNLWRHMSDIIECATQEA